LLTDLGAFRIATVCLDEMRPQRKPSYRRVVSDPSAILTWHLSERQIGELAAQQFGSVSMNYPPDGLMYQL
jgi:hypothetical protein